MTGFRILLFYLSSFIVNLIILNTFDVFQKIVQDIFISIVLKNIVFKILKL